MKKQALASLIAAAAFALAFAGCSSGYGTTGNPSELTGTWTQNYASGSTTTTSKATVTDTTTGTTKLVVTSDGGYTLTDDGTNIPADTTTYKSTTWNFVETGTLSGATTNDGKLVTLNRTKAVTTTNYNYQAASSSYTTVKTDTATGSATYSYYITKGTSNTYLVVYNSSGVKWSFSKSN